MVQPADTTIAVLREEVCRETHVPKHRQLLVVCEERVRGGSLATFVRRCRKRWQARPALRTVAASWANFVFLPEMFNRWGRVHGQSAVLNRESSGKMGTCMRVGAILHRACMRGCECACVHACVHCTCVKECFSTEHAFVPAQQVNDALTDIQLTD